MGSIIHFKHRMLSEYYEVFQDGKVFLLDEQDAERMDYGLVPAAANFSTGEMGTCAYM